MERIFTSESVSRGHPDKLADQISDAVLDEFLKKDMESRVACETFITDGLVVVGGEAHSSAYVDIKEVAKSVLTEAGYTPEFCFDPNNFGLMNTLHEQSDDIRIGVEKKSNNIGAGDQGIMFGYACKDTDSLMPLPIQLANTTMQTYDFLRKTDYKFGKNMGPDAKCQYSVVYDGNKPVGVSDIILSMQHSENADTRTVATSAIYLLTTIMKNNPDLGRYIDLNKTKVNVNPTGRFVIGGPKGDTGLTGRKIIVDTYGGKAPHGGGAFSGKDATKVDRSAAYMARFLAKNIVAAGVCTECLIQLSYAIGVNYPISVYVKTDAGDEYDERVKKVIDNELIDTLTPFGIITRFGLFKPIYYPTSFFGHFGRDYVRTTDGGINLGYFPWEEIDGNITEKFK